MNKEKILKISIIIIAIIVIACLGYLFIREWNSPMVSSFDFTFNRRVNNNNYLNQNENKIAKFKSEQDFKDYLRNAELETGGLGMLGVGNSLLRDNVGVGEISNDSGLRSPAVSESKNAAERVSGTNTQVLGIDEPDIVKTDGKEIYLSRTGFFALPMFRGFTEPQERDLENKTSLIAPIIPENNNQVKIIKAFPPSDISVISQIDKNGNLLLSKDTLVVFSNQTILGYNVSDPKTPKKIWDIELKNNSQLVSARLYNDKVYIVTQEYINSSRPCPLEPMAVNGTIYPIPCDTIYYTRVPIDANVIFSASAIDLQSGKVSNSNSFVGSFGSSIVYMSENAVYITYPYSGDFLGYTYRFFQENSDLFTSEIVEKIGKLKDYDISTSSKINELMIVLERYQNSLTSDQRLKLENEMENRSKDYEKKHRRELQQTGIVKLDAKDLTLQGNNSVPGTLLNQFSLDEYNDHLRVAITIGGIGGGWFGGSSLENTNDIYVFDSNLKEVGSIKDLGKEERIYSVRFIGDHGYMVTFKQIDPFFVLDLSNPKNPQIKGELKIPGYSSYLHPVSKNRILGIGKEDNKVKLSLFDVSNPENPIEKSKYILDEYWSEILSTQYAFLQDKKHSVFFLPGSKGAYVFSYKNDELKLTKAVSEIQAKRALYINDYLYIIGNDKIVVLNENDWEKVNQLGL